MDVKSLFRDGFRWYIDGSLGYACARCPAVNFRCPLRHVYGSHRHRGQGKEELVLSLSQTRQDSSSESE